MLDAVLRWLSSLEAVWFLWLDSNDGRFALAVLSLMGIVLAIASLVLVVGVALHELFTKSWPHREP